MYVDIKAQLSWFFNDTDFMVSTIMKVELIEKEVNIHTTRPGILIGRHGEYIDRVLEVLKRVDPDLTIKIVEHNWETYDEEVPQVSRREG